jgi:hypothetical protein
MNACPTHPVTHKLFLRGTSPSGTVTSIVNHLLHARLREDGTSGSALDLGEPISGSISLELGEGSSIDINGKDHSLSAVGVRCAVGLLAVEEARAVRVEGDVEGMDIRNVIGVEVVEVGVKLSAGDLGAGFLEGRLGKGVVGGAEVEVDALAAADSLEEGWVVDELLVGADEDGDDGSGAAVDLSGALDEGTGGFHCFWGSGGRGKGSEAEEGGSGEELHFDVVW